MEQLEYLIRALTYQRSCWELELKNMTGKSELVDRMESLINFAEPILYKSLHQQPHNKPSKQELESARLHWICFNHIAGKRTFREEYQLILEKKSTLPSACRKFIISEFEK